MKLTNAIRDQIVSEAVDSVIQPLRVEIDQRHSKLGDMIYDLVFAKHEEQARAMPAGWIYMADVITIEAEGYKSKRQEWLKPGELCADLPLSKPRPLPHNIPVALACVDGDPDYLSVTKKSHPAYKVVTELLTAVERVDAKEFEIKMSVRQIVNSVSTVARLLEVWPEGERFLPEMPDVGRMLPVSTMVVRHANALLQIA